MLARQLERLLEQRRRAGAGGPRRRGAALDAVARGAEDALVEHLRRRVGAGSRVASWRARQWTSATRPPGRRARSGRRARGSRPSRAAGAGAASTRTTCSPARRRRARARGCAQKSSKSRIARGTPERGQPRIVTSRARGEAGVAAVAKRRVGAERLQQRQVAAQAVEGADRGLGVRHPDVDVRPADGRRDGVAEQVADALVALLVGDLGLALDGGGMRAGAEHARRRSRRTARRSPPSVPTASPVVRHTSVISSTWQACSSRSTAPSTGPSRSSTAADALVCSPVSGSTRNSSSSTPSVKGSPVPNASVVSSSRVKPPVSPIGRRLKRPLL